MDSPFPGMDPYLEHPGYWRDFHHRFITYWRDWVNDRLPDPYHALIDVRAGGVFDHPWGDKQPLPAAPARDAVPVEREPELRRVKYAEEEDEAFIRIFRQPDPTPIAVLELLSPTNKSAESKQLYLHYRNRLLESPVHLVELDLLLGGARMPIKGKLPPGDCYAYVARGDQRPACEVYGWKLPEPLTRIRLPLKPSDPDLIFDLPALLTQAYQRGRYARRLPYSAPPPVALPEPYAKWAAESVKR